MKSLSGISLWCVIVVLVGCTGRVGIHGTRDGGPGGDSSTHHTCTHVDSDHDGVSDDLEGGAVADADADGTPNIGDTDDDGDGIPTTTEAGSDPCAPLDSDGDGIPDFLDTDSDNDGVSDTDEAAHGTNPTLVDSDGDGVSDLAEGAAGTNPLDPTSTIPSTDFFVVLPYNGPHANRNLDFGTNITKADVYFLMDTTGSMYTEVGNVQTGMETIIIPGVQAMIPDVQFGAGGFDDFPVGSHGGGTDLPFYHLIDIVPFAQDNGSIGGTFVASSDVGTFMATGSNGTNDIIDGVRSYPRHSGGDGNEAGVEAVYQTATGEGISWSGGTIPPKHCIMSPDDPHPPVGYPCFRPGALPIIVYVSDAPFHQPLPSYFMLDTLDGASAFYTDVPTAHTYDQALTALRGIGARVLGLSTDDIPSFPGYPATDNICNLARDTGAVRADGSPLCFQLGSDGTMITSSVVDAISELVGGTPQDVSTRTQNVTMPPNPDNFDATLFIKSITPVMGVGPHGETGPMPGITFDRMDATTFYRVIPGTIVTFGVDFWNDVRPPAAVAQIFQATIIVVGNGVADLSSRHVYIVVPPTGGTILI